MSKIEKSVPRWDDIPPRNAASGGRAVRKKRVALIVAWGLLVSLLLLILVLLVQLLWVCCRKSYRPPFEGDEINMVGYTAEKGKGLGKPDYLRTHYELEGLPHDYLYLTGDGAWYTGTPGGYDHLIMNKNVEEPILCYKVYKVQFRKADGEIVTIEDRAILDSLSELRKSGEATEIELTGDSRLNTSFYFDLPCRLEWMCRIVQDQDRVGLICWDVVSGKWYDYDATAILSGIL